MSASLSILSASTLRSNCGCARRLPRCPPPLPPLLFNSVRPSALRPSPFSQLLPRYYSPSRIAPGLSVVSAAPDGGVVAPEEGSASGSEVSEARGQSTMPERFRHLTKEVPDRPVRWPWLIAPVFLVYAWRAVLWELSNWKNAALAVVRFVGYLSKLLIAIVFHFVGPLVTALIWAIEFALNYTRSIYSGIVACTPIPELLWIILLTSVVMAIAEATVPDSMNSQPYLLTVSGLLSYGAVGGSVPELLFWLAMVGMFFYSRFVNKRDDVSAALPPTIALVAIGQLWVRAVAMAAYLGLAIMQHSKSPKVDAQGGRIPTGTRTRPPLPLLLLALAIGIHLAAKWVRYRHLTWMIV